MDEQRWSLRSANLVSELFDDELVAVDVDTGRYFTLDLVGATIFGLLAAGHGLADVSAMVARRHGEPVDTVAGHVETFAAELVAEGLLAPFDGTTTEVIIPVPEPVGRPFAPPTLAAYTDMQDLLLLDPIHDVDAAGWPVRPE